MTRKEKCGRFSPPPAVTPATPARGGGEAAAELLESFAPGDLVHGRVKALHFHEASGVGLYLPSSCVCGGRGAGG